MRYLPMPLLAATLSLGAVMMAFVATLARGDRDETASPAWSDAAAIALVVYSLLIIPYLLLIRRRLLSPAGDRLRAKGLAPANFVAFSGTVMFLSPACIAMFLSLAGMPLVNLYVATVFSIAGMVCWAWFHRR